MTFIDVITRIVLSAASPISPQEIREIIKKEYPAYYGSPSHIRNVEKGHYKDLNHALLAQVYSTIKNHKNFLSDKTSRPLRVSYREERNTGLGAAKQDNRIIDLVSPPVRATDYREKIKDILSNSEKYHKAYYDAEIFRGPSLYFHQRALETRHPPGSLAHLEYIYAMLASWGMHRTGKKGSKMKGFSVFRKSVESLRDQLADIQRYDFREMDEQRWETLKGIFWGLDIMASETSLVGNSKALHHMIPNVVPPIDREYTLWYLLGHKNIKNNLRSEWELMKDIIVNFFIPVASDLDFENRAQGWMRKTDAFPWDTSIFKIVDNLIIGTKKAQG